MVNAALTFLECPFAFSGFFCNTGLKSHQVKWHSSDYQFQAEVIRLNQPLYFSVEGCLQEGMLHISISSVTERATERLI